jgi:hypothetical protein
VAELRERFGDGAVRRAAELQRPGSEELHGGP